jgi:translocation and assembly module TamA
VRVVTADAVAPDGSLPVRVTVAERPPRFVGFGVVYSTTDGLAVNGYWGHRNLFGQAERLRLEASAGGIEIGDFGDDFVDEIDYRVRLTFLKPDFLTTDQDLRVELQALAERPEAFEREAVEGTIAIDRRLNDEITLGAGVTAVVERVRENDEAESETFTFIGLPLTAAFDNTDDALDPTEGVRLRLATTPFPEFLGSSQDLLVNRIDASAYADFGTDGRFVLAGRTALGSLLGGDDTLDVPASRRFYAGGGGSVRGYAFQTIGPQDELGDPIGGRSLFEASLELRYRITDTIGIVPFVDAGAVYDSEFPDFSEDLQIGAGLGGRYYTGFGPLRLDVALPLNKREEDDAFAVYVSLGQAF